MASDNLKDDLMTTLPALKTARLELRPATPADVDALWALWREPDVRRYLFDDQPVTRERAAEVLDHCLAAAKEGLGLWLVAHPDDPAALGCVGLTKASAAVEYDASLAGAVEPIASFSPSVWGRGYAHEALSAVIAYAFRDLGLDKLTGINDAPNEASDRMMKRLGFRITGEIDGPRHRLRTYVLTKESSAAPAESGSAGDEARARG
jgi:RimJ/RimL family protein N-acetyltransferase